MNTIIYSLIIGTIFTLTGGSLGYYWAKRRFDGQIKSMMNVIEAMNTRVHAREVRQDKINQVLAQSMEAMGKLIKDDLAMRAKHEEVKVTGVIPNID